MCGDTGKDVASSDDSKIDALKGKLILRTANWWRHILVTFAGPPIARETRLPPAD